MRWSSRKRSVRVALGIASCTILVAGTVHAQVRSARTGPTVPSRSIPPTSDRNVPEFLPASSEEEWPTWTEAAKVTRATGRPLIVVVTSAQEPRSIEYVNRLRADRTVDAARRSGAIEFAELSAEEAPEQVGRLKITTFPSIMAYRRGARGLEAAGRLQGAVGVSRLTGWCIGLGLITPPREMDGDDNDRPATADRERSNRPAAQAPTPDPELKRTNHYGYGAYPSPQNAMAPPPPYIPPPPPQAAPPAAPQVPTYQVMTPQAAPPQAAPPQAAPPQGIPITVNVPQQYTVNVPQQAILLQQAPPQAAPLNILSAAPVQPTLMAAPPQPPVAAAPPQPVVMAAPPQPVVMAAPPQQVVMAAPPQQVVMAAPPQQVVMAAPVQPVMMAAPAQTVVAAAPSQRAGLTLPGLNVPGANLSLRAPGMVDRFVGRIGKKLRERSYPRVAVDIEAAEAAAEAEEVEVVVEKQPPRRYTINQSRPKHYHEHEHAEPPPPPPPGPYPSPQGEPPVFPSLQR